MAGPAGRTSKLASLRESLAARGLAPRRSLGQNFMVDPNFAAFVARAAGPDERTLVIEVGPGTGCLTDALLRAHPAARVLAVEIDRGLAGLLRETMAEPIAQGRLTLLEGDVLAGKDRLSPELLRAALDISSRERRPRRVLCSNLPYNAATPILMNIAAEAEGFGVESAVATVQEELAERLLARPGCSDYGAPTVFLALRADGEILRRVGKEVFWPRPEVNSAVIRLAFRPWDDLGSSRDDGASEPRPSGSGDNRLLTRAAPTPLRRDEAGPFHRFLQQLFSHRRKVLRAALKPREVPRELHIPPNARAEELAPHVLLELYRRTAFATEATEDTEDTEKGDRD